MAKIRHPEWRASNDDTKYPFSHTASLVNDVGDVIFETTFLDASFYPVGGNAELYLSKVVVASDTVTLYIGDNFEQEVASATFNRPSPPDIIRFADAFGRPAGVIVSEAVRLSVFSSWSIGTHEFTIDQTAFVARCCHAVPDIGIRGFELDDGSVVTGDVWLVGDDGVVLTCEDATVGTACTEEQTVKVVRVDIVGDPLFRRKLCTDPGIFETPKFLQKITFCSPSILGSSSISSVDSSSESSSSFLTENDADILFLTDTTGSMGSTINQIKALFEPLVDEVDAAFPDLTLKWGATEYKDSFDGEPFQTDHYLLNQALTENTVDVQGGINTWTANGGGDTPEDSWGALVALCDDWLDELEGREEATKIVVWSGDAEAQFGTGDPPDVFFPLMSTVIAKLLERGVYLIACNTEGSGMGIDKNSEATDILEEVPGVLVNNIAMRTTEEMLEILSDAIQLAITTGGTKSVRRVTRTVFPGQEGECVTCGPGEYGDVKLFVHSLTTPDTILRMRPVKEGLIIETVGERLEDIR